MPSPFPGMNPYLENPELWAEVQSWLVIAIADAIAPQLRPKYRVAVEKRVYQMIDENSILIGIPDVTIGRSLTNTDKEKFNIAVASPPAKPITVNLPIPEEVREGYLEVREVGTGEVVVTIEVLSPKNKRSGEGRKAYESKRQQILSTFTHLIEIDLLRGGEPMPILGNQIKSDYRILVSRSESRPKAELYPFGLQEQIPTFLLPLGRGDTEPLVDLQALIHGVYERAGFDLAVDYTCEPVPPFFEADAIWANELLQQQGLH
ncbi:DUF4058 family protein [Desmonostoc muscorum LEGE 12446]|uniref:DUF4058 family protein n=1 Tax=Desmonostoc muscorum LEGE 12446 TaxID=1828758 RepID=A0A8J7AAM7_DESMC|nr:DUF4058 family protein [Desmonostoc muscorum]MCF2148353.1 DUF4058 family protein [Desmonostoc muscorum LEGE 12446]